MLVGEIPILVPQNNRFAAAQALRATGNEVSGLPSPVLHTCSLSASTEPVFAIQFYEMAAKDKLCGNNLVALKDLDLGAWIDKPGDVDCEDQRWIGAPDPANDLKRRTYNDGLTGWTDPFSPCADAEPHSPLALGWYLLAWHFQCIYLFLLLHHFIAKEKATRAREMRVQPAVDTDDNPGDNPAGVIILQDRVEKRLLCRMLTHWKMLVDEILWVPGGKRFREIVSTRSHMRSGGRDAGVE